MSAENREWAVCMACHGTRLQAETTGEYQRFTCLDCGHVDDRVMTLGGIRIDWLAPWTPRHYTAGAVVLDEGRILLMKRRVWPYGYAIPAGHVAAGESARQALEREVEEELGAPATDVELLWSDRDIDGDRCRKGADTHSWAVFSCKVDKAAIWTECDEAAKFVWANPAEALALELTYATSWVLRSIGWISR